jgi:hypothetical protein
MLAATATAALIAPSNAAVAQQTAPVAVVQPPDPNAPKVAVVPPTRPGAPPTFAILPPTPGAPAVAVVPPTSPGAPPALAVIPPDPSAPPVAIVPPPGGAVRIVIPVPANAVAGLPDCSSSVTTHCVLNGRHASR